MKRKFNFCLFAFCTLFLFQNCNQNKETAGHPEQSIDEQIKLESKTNIRFASIKDGYKEQKSGKRFTTTHTKETSQYFQMEGPAWENENVAFRNYFDARNGIDVFGKRKSDMVLDSVGINENYHELQDWGMDILKVGNSLGAGAIGLIIGDSLYRIGSNGNGTFNLISENENQSSFRLSFDDFKINGRIYKIDHEIEILAGTHFYKSTVSIKGLKGDEILVSGIVAHMDNLTRGNTSAYNFMGTHGIQAEDGSNLGMAVAVPKKYFIKTSKSTDYKGSIDNSHLMEIKLIDGKAEYCFFTGWELQDPQFNSAVYFMQTVTKELNNIQ